MWYRLSNYVRKNPAKIAGYLSAIVLYINKRIPGFPIDIIIPSIMLLIAMGEGAQKLEDRKTIEALYTPNDPAIPDSKIIENIDGKV